MATYKEVLKQAQKQMLEKDLGDQAPFLYLLELTNMEAHNLYMEMDQEIEEPLRHTYEEGIKRMCKGEPLSHILGYEWFYGYRFNVNPHVLIPRPETEELVAYILAACDELFSKQETITAADIGTGSGAIAIALKKEASYLQILGTDIRADAIQVANHNAVNNEVMVPFIVGDMLEPIIDRNLQLDILISNPPYIPQEEKMEKSVVDFEPHVALFGGEDGLKFYRIIFEKCRQVLKDRSMMAFEMGWNQRKPLEALVQSYFPDARYEFIKDMSGKERMLFIYFHC